MSETSPAGQDKTVNDNKTVAAKAETSTAEVKTAEARQAEKIADEKKAEKEKPKTTKHKKAKSHGHGLAWLLVFILLGVIAVGGYLGWKQGKVIIDSYLARLQGLESALKLQTEESQQFANKIDEFAQRQGHVEQGLNSYLEQSSNRRKDWLLAEAEYLVKLASHRLLLERDINTAIVALNAADARLSEMGDPALIRVRKQLAKDIQRLRAVPALDLAGVSLSLSAMIQAAEKLPLQTPDPEAIKERLHGEDKVSREVTDWRSFLAAVWDDLKSLVVIRDHAQPIQPLMSPEQRFFLVQNLQLQLEQARLAVLQGEKQVYRERLQQVQAWVQRYFDVTQAATANVLQTLNELLDKDISPELPDVGGSYKAIETFRQAQGAGKRRGG